MFDAYNMGQQLDMKFYAEREHPRSSQQLTLNMGLIILKVKSSFRDTFFILHDLELEIQV